MSSIDLIEPPQKILCRSVHIVATRIVGEVVPKRGPAQLLLEQVEFVEE